MLMLTVVASIIATTAITSTTSNSAFANTGIKEKIQRSVQESLCVNSILCQVIKGHVSGFQQHGTAAGIYIPRGAQGPFSTANPDAQLNMQPSIAQSSPGYLIINQALVQTSGLNAIFRTNAIIPTDGSGGAFGYGIITSQGIAAVIVATTHQGVRDSVTQGADAGPIWHNHFVQLGFGVTGLCGSNPEVVAITLQQPGKVLISGSQALLQGIPSSFTGTDALTGNPITLSPGHNVQNVVSFILDPKFQGGSLKAVCVEHITPAQHIIKR
jgi:hypothetical protein